jgi:superfamily II DNA or RNA helicase
MSWSQTPKELFSYIQENYTNHKKILFRGPTACGKTTMIHTIPTLIRKDKLVFIILSPGVAIQQTINYNLNKKGITVFSFSDFRKIKPTNSTIVISATHSSINNSDSTVHQDGDTKGVLRILREYSENGYQVITIVDESHIFINNENNESFKIIESLPKNSLEIHFTATPQEDLSTYDKVFNMPDEEVKKTGRVKTKIEVHKLGHSDDYEMINDILQKREEICKYYEGNTVTAQFICETGSSFESRKKMIVSNCEKYNIKLDEVMDLTVEGKDENLSKIDEFISETRNTNHKYKVIITKFAGGVGLDVPSISILGIMRKIDKKSETQHVQFQGRGLRTYNGKIAKNPVQDTLYIFVKEDFEFPEYLQSQFQNSEKNELLLNQKINLNFFKVLVPEILSVNIEKNEDVFKKLVSNFDFKNILNLDSTQTTIMKGNESFALSANTIDNFEKETINNIFDEMDWETAFFIKDKFKNLLNSEFESTFDLFLKNLEMEESNFVVTVKNNPIFREKIELFSKIFKKNVKKFVVGPEPKKYKFPSSITKHKTHIDFTITPDFSFYEKLLYHPIDSTIYFDSSVEKDFFINIISKKSTQALYHNPRTKQGGISFYIPEKDVTHAPDFVYIQEGTIYFVEVTDFSKIREKEDFIKSDGVPNNYLLVVNYKGKLLSLKKEDYKPENFYKPDFWTKF